MQDGDVDVEALTPRKKIPRKKAKRATVLNFTAREEADIITWFQDNPVLYDSKLIFCCQTSVLTQGNGR